MKSLVVFASLAGCGRFDFDSRPDGPMSDALARAPFSTPIPLTELNHPTFQDDDPSLTEDMLEIFFDSARGGDNGEVWTASRLSITDPFSAPRMISELVSPNDDTSPDVSPDGLTMYFGSDRFAPGDRDLFITTRVDRTSPWSAPQRVVELASAQGESSAYETADGLSIYIATGRAGPTTDICVATRATQQSAWSTPVPVPGVSDPVVSESQHWINHDATTIYYSTGPTGGQDLWVATRSAPDQPFDVRMRVPELNGAFDDGDAWLTADLRTIVFTKYETGAGDLYFATR